MMPKLQDLLARKVELEKQIEDTRRQEKADAIAQVRTLMAEHGLTASDLSMRGKSAAKGSTGRKVAPKYRDPATGDTWSGRGLQPKWLRAALSGGKKLTDFAL
jgi:DNA-binding protein H-NS